MTAIHWDDESAPATRLASGVIVMVALSLAMFLLWAKFAALDEIVTAEGKVVSSSRPQIIQNLEGGILAELAVSEGMVVEAGQYLGRLQSTQYQAAAEDLGKQLASHTVRLLRLEAEMNGADRFSVPDDIAALVPDVLASETALLTARRTDYETKTAGATAVLEQAARELDIMERMLAQDVVPAIEVTRARKSHRDAENRLADIVTQTDLERASDHAKVLSEVAGIEQKLRVARDQLERTTLLSPLRGVVNKISVSTIGGVVRSGEEIMQIIALDDELFVDALVKPRDIAAVREGQEAVIKLSAWDYTIYGSLHGEVTFVSADTFRDDRARGSEAEPHYIVTLRVRPPSDDTRQSAVEIRPGMQAAVELDTGSKTVLSYLLKPLYKSTEALRER